MMKLYSMPMAANPRRLHMFLAEKAINLDTVVIDLLKAENLEPAFLAVNPRGTVPTLVLDDGTVLDESIAICRYLEALHPEPNLFGRDPQEIAVIENWQRRIEFEGFLNIADAFRNKAPRFKDRAKPGVKGRCPQIPELAERGRQLATQFFTDLDAHLAHSSFVAGVRFTVADITAFVSVEFAKRTEVPLGEASENITRWHGEIAKRPSAKI